MNSVLKCTLHKGRIAHVLQVADPLLVVDRDAFNSDVVEHDYTIDDLELKIEAAVGSTGEATLTDVAAGTYRVYCTVPGHEAAGMVGELVVTA